MTSAEQRNVDATVAEYKEQLRQVAVDALLAGVHRDAVTAGLRELLQRLEEGDKEENVPGPDYLIYEGQVIRKFNAENG